MSRSVLDDSLLLSSVPRVRHVLEAFPHRWFFHCETPAFSSIRARCDWSVPFRWSAVVDELYDVTDHRALQRMRDDLYLGCFKVRRSQQEQCIHWKEADNNAFRVYHDLKHMETGLGFSSPEELSLAELVTGETEYFRRTQDRWGRSWEVSHSEYLNTRDSTAFIHWVETVCQVVGQRFTGDFPAQSNCLTQAEERAIILQYERIYHVVL